VGVVDAAVDGAEGAAGDDALDDELGRVDLPVLPPRAPGVRPGASAALVGAPGGLLLALLHGPGAAEVALQLLVQALEVDLVRPHEPPVPAAATALLHGVSWRAASPDRLGTPHPRALRCVMIGAVAVWSAVAALRLG